MAHLKATNQPHNMPRHAADNQENDARTRILERLMRHDRNITPWPLNPTRPIFEQPEPTATDRTETGSASPETRATAPSVATIFLNRLDSATHDDATQQGTAGLASICQQFAVLRACKTFALAPAIMQVLPDIQSRLETSMSFKSDPRIDSCDLGITMAHGAVCETGGLLMVHCAATPPSHLLFPDHVIVLVDRTRIFRYYEDIPVDNLGAVNGNALSLITGPSRSADIEQTLILGAHGALTLHVILADHFPSFQPWRTRGR